MSIFESLDLRRRKRKELSAKAGRRGTVSVVARSVFDREVTSMSIPMLSDDFGGDSGRSNGLCWRFARIFCKWKGIAKEVALGCGAKAEHSMVLSLAQAAHVVRHAMMQKA